jgi:hypothetical protein
LRLRIAGTFFASALLIVTAFTAMPVRAQMFAGLPVDSIQCQSSEGAAEHVHTHLQLFNRGHAVAVPAQIGIPEGAGCLYWVHTHSADGIIHIEAPVVRTFTLGQFFDVWGQDLSRTQAGPLHATRGRNLRITVNGKVWTKDPRSIPLRDHEEIVIQNGPPYVAGRPADWSSL